MLLEFATTPLLQENLKRHMNFISDTCKNTHTKAIVVVSCCIATELHMVLHISHSFVLWPRLLVVPPGETAAKWACSEVGSPLLGRQGTQDFPACPPPLSRGARERPRKVPQFGGELYVFVMKASLVDYEQLAVRLEGGGAAVE